MNVRTPQLNPVGPLLRYPDQLRSGPTYRGAWGEKWNTA